MGLGSNWDYWSGSGRRARRDNGQCVVSSWSEVGWGEQEGYQAVSCPGQAEREGRRHFLAWRKRHFWSQWWWWLGEYQLCVNGCKIANAKE